MTVHGDGSYKREWTHVGDNCQAILLVMERGQDGEIYNISAGEMLTNLEVIKMVLRVMNKPEDFIEFVPNRSGQDLRYSVNSDKVKKLGWTLKMNLERYLPICEELNELRRHHQPLSKKKRLLSLFGLAKKHV